MAAVDANVLVRAFLDSNSKERLRAEKAIGEGVWVSHLVLREFFAIAVGVYGLSRSVVLEIVDRWLTHETLVVEEPSIVIAVLARLRQVPALDFDAVLILEITRARGKLPLGTFDSDLGKQDGAELA